MREKEKINVSLQEDFYDSVTWDAFCTSWEYVIQCRECTNTSAVCLYSAYKTFLYDTRVSFLVFRIFRVDYRLIGWCLAILYFLLNQCYWLLFLVSKTDVLYRMNCNLAGKSIHALAILYSLLWLLYIHTRHRTEYCTYCIYCLFFALADHHSVTNLLCTIVYV